VNNTTTKSLIQLVNIHMMILCFKQRIKTTQITVKTQSKN